ncbi:putative histone deacetylase-like protein, partial [Metschnikowia bicuspidata var. bicuspidata NRRL YB-4993]
MPLPLEKQLVPLIKALQEKKKVTFFLGAGISTSCGIPDFRSPKTGLYANLKRLNLPYPEAVFDIDYFRENPKAFYTLCDELYPGKFFPSKFHFLLKLVHDNDLLARIYTQNIDTMESLVGIHPDKIVAAHGSFATNHCIECAEPMETEDLVKLMGDKSVNDGIPQCGKCKGYVKPDIVFFGEALPVRFFDMWEEDCDNVDIAIVAGTSLTVYPFAGLPAECHKTSLRVLVNNEVVGDFKTKKRKTDLLITNDCDVVAETIAKELGWEQQLQKLISEEKKKFDAKSKTS